VTVSKPFCSKLIFNEYINGRYYFCKNSFKGPMGKAQ